MSLYYASSRYTTRLERAPAAALVQLAACATMRARAGIQSYKDSLDSICACAGGSRANGHGGEINNGEITAVNGTRRKVPARRLYRYVGPPDIPLRANASGQGTCVRSATDLNAWVITTQQRADTASLIPATFVIDADGYLRIADRHCEHVVCAGGGYVRSAGEIFFTREVTGWAVEQISNQSTGYCPEPESWPEVAAALDAIPLAHPAYFTFACVFRRCPRCSQLNLVKDDVFECAVCAAGLPSAWNADPGAASAHTDLPD